jgi:integrase
MTQEKIATGVPNDRFLEAIAALPPLPKRIQYEDDYDEKVRNVKVADTEESLTLHTSGAVKTLKFLRYSPRVRQLVRVYLLFSLQELATSSVSLKFYELNEISADDIEQAASGGPVLLRETWPVYVAKYSYQGLVALRGLLHFLCSVQFMSWSTAYRDFVSKALFVTASNPYARVRSGDAFLTIEEESRLVRWIDDAALKSAELLPSQVQIACLLTSAYQFGMRPKQLGVIRNRNCKVRFSAEDGSPIFHLTFHMVKQKNATLARLPLVRKVKREWATLFVQLMKFKSLQSADDFLFGFQSSVSLSSALSDQLEVILPESQRRITYDLRHSLAQRLVDAGASHEELAAALGHTNLSSGLVYFRQSANQAEIVNKAMGLSPIYVAVASIVKIKFISKEELARLKGEQQIAGAPHGIPIAGIGGCRTGQSSCPYNPVTACYGCEKFTPVSDLELHKQVLAEMRSVVTTFKDVSRGETTSPAYLQLRQTISEIQAVIVDLEDGTHE